MENRPKVGVGVIVLKDGKILFGKRKNTHWNGSWGAIGGHLEFNESWEECAMRETLEETGLYIKNIKFVTATNDIFPVEHKHYITIFMTAEYESGELQIMEPEKFEEWSWLDWSNLPSPLFMSLQNLIKLGFDPYSK